MLANLWLDEPKTKEIQTPFAYLRGWIDAADSGGTLEVKVGDQSVACARVPRPDLADSAHIGIAIFLDLLTLHQKQTIQPGPLSFRILLDNQPLTTIDLSVMPAALQGINELIANRACKAEFVRRHSSRALSSFRGCNAPSALPVGWPIDPAMSAKADAVSAHFYGPVIDNFFDSLGPDAMILDAGAGFRSVPRKNVVHLEIYDYPSTDVLGVGQDLPFRDNTFDGALSLAVLEHVDDPFRCARELIRVVKPGGRIMAIVPFLQAEHGYPSHYFNCTRFGLQRLFASTNVVSHFMEISNHPIHTLNQILGLYANGLPPEVREKFLDMTVADFVTRSGYEYQAEKADFITQISEEACWLIAWGTTAIFEKPLGWSGANTEVKNWSPNVAMFEKAGAPGSRRIEKPVKSGLRASYRRARQLLKQRGLAELCRRVVRKCLKPLQRGKTS